LKGSALGIQSRRVGLGQSVSGGDAVEESVSANFRKVIGLKTLKARRVALSLTAHIDFKVVGDGTAFAFGDVHEPISFRLVTRQRIGSVNVFEPIREAVAIGVCLGRRCPQGFLETVTETVDILILI
jgi:hypothetical protein